MTTTGRRLKRLPATTREAINRHRTGREVMSAELWSAAQTRQQELQTTSVAIAESIERAGGKAFRDGPAICEIGLVTLTERVRARGFRNNNCIPAVMVANTRGMRRDLTAFVSEHRVSGTTLTLGTDLHPISVLADKIQSMTRIASRIAGYLSKKYRVDVIFSNTEVTAHRGALGELLFHVHCHLLVDHATMKRELYRAMIAGVRARAPSAYAAAEAFTSGDSAKKLARYCIAPETFPNVEMSDDEALKFSEAVRGKKFYRPLGTFKVWRKQFQAVKKAIFVVPNPADSDRFIHEPDGTIQERKRRPPLSIDVGQGQREDILTILRVTRRAVSAYVSASTKPYRATSRELLAEAIRARVDLGSSRSLVRQAISSVGARASVSVLDRRARRFAVLRELARLGYALMMRTQRKQTVVSASRAVTVKDDKGRESTARLSTGEAKPVWFEPSNSIAMDLVVHRSVATPRTTRRMEPSIVIANRSDCSVVSLLKVKKLVSEHLKQAALWNARCDERERVRVAPELVGQSLVVDGHTVGFRSGGRWLPQDGAAYRSEFHNGDLYIYDVGAEREVISRNDVDDKELMPHIDSTTAPSEGPEDAPGAGGKEPSPLIRHLISPNSTEESTKPPQAVAEPPGSRSGSRLEWNRRKPLQDDLAWLPGRAASGGGLGEKLHHFEMDDAANGSRVVAKHDPAWRIGAPSRHGEPHRAAANGQRPYSIRASLT